MKASSCHRFFQQGAGIGLLVGTLLGGGCLGSFQGEVGGEEIPRMQSGMWWEMEGNDFPVVEAVAADFPSICATWSGWWAEYQALTLEGLEGEPLVQALEALDRTWLPETGWEARWRFAGGNGDSTAGGYVPSAEETLIPGEVNLTLCHQTGWRDWRGLLAGEAGAENRVCHQAGAGAVELLYLGDETAKITGEVELFLVDEAEVEASEPVGEQVSFSLALERCVEMEAEGGTP